MNLRWTLRSCVALLTLWFLVVQAQAQNTGPIAPIGSPQLPVPAARTLDIEPSPVDSPRPQADTHTLSSIERLGIGSLGVVRSFIDPSFHLKQSLDTGIVPGVDNSVTTMGVGLQFDRNTSRSRLLGFYNGAHALYRPSSVNDSTFHSLTLSQEVRWARWALRLRDDFLVSPEAAFGGLDTGGVHSQIGFQSSTGAADTILTQRARRLNNLAAGEINYLLSRRSTLTFAGAYSSLIVDDPRYIDSHGVTARVGYDHALTPKDSIGLIYNYTRTAFSGANPLLQTDMVQLAYGRKVTGRLAFQVSAGPLLLRSGSLNTLDWSLATATTYQTRRAGYSLSYARGASSGSGVFSGTQSHTVAASVNLAFTRSWNASLNGGYAFNQALVPVAGMINSLGSWVGAANLGRTIGRHLKLAMNYGYQQQNSAVGTCPVAACGSTPSRHIVGIAMEWHPWSMVQR